jgi:MFS family permease
VSRRQPFQFPFYRGWMIVAAGFTSQMATVGTTGWIFGVLLLPMQNSFGWSRSLLVGVLTVSSLIGGSLSAALGPWVDRHGVRALMSVSALLAGGCLMLLRFVTAPWQYYMLLGLGFGLAIPGLWNLGPAVAISNWFVRRRPLAITIFSFGSLSAGIFLTPIIAWIEHVAGWRTAWTVMGGLEWCVIPLAWIWIRRRPEDVGLLTDGDRPGSTAHAAERSSRPHRQGATDQAWTVREALHTRSFWLVTIAFTLVMLPASSIFVHMTAYIGSKGFSAAVGVSALSIYGLSSAVGRAIWGFVISRAGIHRSLVAFGFTYGLSIVAFMLPNNIAAIYATTIFLGIAIAASQQLQTQSYPDYFGRRIVGALLGYAGLFFMITRATAPLFAAIVFDATGSYLGAFGLFAVACFIASAAFLFAPPPVRRAGETQVALAAGGEA